MPTRITMYTTVKKRQKLKRPLVFFALTLLFILYILLSKKPKARSTVQLAINAVPRGARITVDEQFSSETQFQKLLDKGPHEIKVSKEGYFTYEKNVNLASEMFLEIRLFEKIDISRISVSTTRALRPSTLFDKTLANEDTIIGINKRSSDLVAIRSESIENIFTGNVSFYSFNYPLVIFLDENYPNNLFLADIETKKTQTLPIKNSSPIISASLALDKEGFYFLGNYNPETRRSDLYFSLIDGTSPVALNSTTANKVASAASNKLVIFELADALDLSTITIFDTEERKPVLALTGNSYSVSPSGTKVAVRSSAKLAIVDTNTLTEKSRFVSKSSDFIWEDEDTLLEVKNLHQGIEIAFVDSNNMESSPALQIEQLQEITFDALLGIKENILFIEDVQGHLWKITLP